jgi:glyoxylase-like metal-dependent hydrolase (beta-lactamase superfamily II)
MGHMCFHESDKKLLFAGDHILNDITPNIQLWSDQWNPLKEYMASLDKIYDLDIRFKVESIIKELLREIV